MAVYIIKSAQNKASIMNLSVGLLLTEEYFTVTGCYGSYKYAYKLRRIFPVQCHRRGRGEEDMRRGGGDYERRTEGEMKRRRGEGEGRRGRGNEDRKGDERWKKGEGVERWRGGEE